MDIVLKLRELRRGRGMTQQAAARAAGIGVKTLSSFETGKRIESLKLTQLHRLLTAYGLSEVEFFNGCLEGVISLTEEGMRASSALAKLRRLAVLEQFVADMLVLDRSANSSRILDRSADSSSSEEWMAAAERVTQSLSLEARQ